jgi:anaphase-promoting complex subunit 1
MFTFASVPTVTTEVYTVPKINLTVRLFPFNALVSPDPGKIHSESLQWADFHNGVASALRISPSSGAIDSSWIAFNKPTDLTPEHAGFLYGLGLTGHLKGMLTWHTFGYLTPKHDLTSIGVLLGLSAAHVGTCSKHVTKLLAVHTPALLPTQGVDLNVPLLTQAAGLVGCGLLYMGSKNRRMAEVALDQISRKELLQPDLSNEHREAYTTAAALAFGMIMLGRGVVSSSPADTALLSRLRVLIHGEPRTSPTGKPIKPTFDVNLTSPAATIALALMYLRTNRQDIADILTIPETILALNHMQPNFLLVRTLARALIMWDDIEPSDLWILSQIPPSITLLMNETRTQGKMMEGSIEIAFYHIIAGACFAMGLKYAGTAREEAYSRIIRYYDLFARTPHMNGKLS